MSQYTGTATLEVMQEAINYNNYLLHLIQSNTKIGDKILDFGSGIGTFAVLMKEKGFDVSCLEPDTELLRRIKNKGLTGFLDLSEIPNNKYDFIYSLNVFEHIKDEQDAMVKLREKLKPSGRVFIYVPAFQILYSSMDRKVGHYRRYTLSGLAEIVKKAGFKILDAQYVDSIGFFAALIFKLFGNQDGDVNKKGLILFDKFVFPVSKIVDWFTKKIFGKNVFVVATRGYE
ncbi:MAG: class I SAM-dependent methyltransferase [Burkholderiaceae bacterium]|jgi:2-polyprenyl-3-methyl-5-hydroxy-6-metoxy-1,4-benzoquinol methylase|nr:class I SAM-dependent methyltransferase [Burkholderiaceae bacterium]